MKIRFFMLPAFLFACTVSNGQQSKLKIGIHAGLSSFNIKNFVGDKYLTGFTTGVYLVQPLSGKFDFQPELNFQRQGSQSTYTASMGDMNGIKFEDKYKLNYLNIPLLFAFKLPKTPLKIYAGPQPGFLLSATLSHHPEDYESMKTDIKGNLHSFAFSGVCGLSLHIPAGNRNTIVFDGRFSNEFTRLNKAPASDHGKNYGFTFTIGYQF
jgi:hypothetical protein